MSAGIEVDGSRPAVAVVTALPREYRLTTAERIVLLALACDSYDGATSAPGYAALAQWSGLSQGVLTKSLRSLCAPTEHRPALLAKRSTGGRNVTEWCLLLEPVGTPDRITTEPSYPQPVGDADQFELLEPVGQPVGQPVGNADDALPSPGDISPKDVTTDRAHASDERARTALARIIAERRLSSLTSVDELLTHAYRLGHGDPFEGYREIKTRTEATLEGARDQRRVLLSRLEPPAPPRPAATPQRQHRHMFDPQSGYCQGCGIRDDAA